MSTHCHDYEEKADESINLGIKSTKQLLLLFLFHVDAAESAEISCSVNCKQNHEKIAKDFENITLISMYLWALLNVWGSYEHVYYILKLLHFQKGNILADV